MASNELKKMWSPPAMQVLNIEETAAVLGRRGLREDEDFIDFIMPQSWGNPPEES